MLGDGYSPGFEGPGPSFVGEDPRGRKAVLPGDSEQEDSEPESSWRRRLMSSSCPETTENSKFKILCEFIKKCRRYEHFSTVSSILAKMHFWFLVNNS